jgi:hypothetical protein
MKILTISMVVVACSLMLAGVAHAAPDQNRQTTVTASVGDMFSLEFYTDPNVLYTTTVPFTNVDPANQYNYANGRAASDGRSDVGLLVKSNQGKVWYLKIGVNSGSSLLGKLGCFMGQPWNRNWDTVADGSLGRGDWFNIPVDSNPETMYTAGTGDQTNTPLGTLATLSYKIDGTGLVPGSHNGVVTYTLTEAP